MQVNKAKLQAWLNTYKPTCNVCGEENWETLDDGTALINANDLGKQIPVAPLICKKCGYVNLIAGNNLIK